MRRYARRALVKCGLCRHVWYALWPGRVEHGLWQSEQWAEDDCPECGRRAVLIRMAWAGKPVLRGEGEK